MSSFDRAMSGKRTRFGLNSGMLLYYDGKLEIVLTSVDLRSGTE